MSDPERLWSVSLVVEEADANRLSHTDALTAMQALGVEAIRIGPAAPEDDLDSLRFELRAPDGEAAEERAQNLALQGRRAVGLPDMRLPVAWVTPSGIGAKGVSFLDEAEELFESEQFELAVVAAGIHFEVQLKSMAEIAVADARDSVGPRNKGRRRWVEGLLDRQVAEIREWPEFEAHLVRRNAIVHEGLAVGSEEARASLDAVRALWLRLGEANRAGEASES